jgi:ubiquinol-cytochrome c reductase cytochrome c1 subunit
MFTSEKPADTIQSALAPADAKKWFGNAPPDLSLIARSRGTSYLYAFLRGFYRDPTRPTGVNNIMLPGTAMPHVLNSLQGVQTAVFKTEDGKAEFEKFELTDKGSMTPAQFDEFVRDTVNFLEYAGEPAQAKRLDLGVWVTLFLLLFAAFSYMLYKDYWRDVH